MKTDILTLLQDKIDAAQDAIGKRHGLDGPYGAPAANELWTAVKNAIEVLQGAEDDVFWTTAAGIAAIINNEEVEEEAEELYKSHEDKAIFFGLLGSAAGFDY